MYAPLHLTPSLQPRLRSLRTIFCETMPNTIVNYYYKIHEENTKEITTAGEVFNRQEICVDLHKL